MIRVIHGDDQFTSRQNFLMAIDRFRESHPQAEIVKLSFPEQAWEQVATLGGQESLFHQQRVIALEKFLSSAKPKEFQKIINLSSRLALGSEIIFWEERALSPAKINAFNSLKNISILNFPLKKTLFKFLDEIKPKNQAELIKTLNAALKDNPFELVLSVLKNHLRLLIIFSSPRAREKVKLPFWRQAKLEQQTESFAPGQLEKLYSEIIEMEYQQRSGSPLSPKLALEMIIVKSLK